MSLDSSDQIAAKIISVLQADSTLSVIKKWHKVNGLVPGLNAGVSAGCDKINFEENTRDTDRATAEMKIYVYVNDSNPERAETTVAALAALIRFVLTNNYKLDGMLATSYVKEMSFVYAEQEKDLTAIAIDYEAIYYAPRLKRPDGPLVEHINPDMKPEPDTIPGVDPNAVKPSVSYVDHIHTDFEQESEKGGI